MKKWRLGIATITLVVLVAVAGFVFFRERQSRSQACLSDSSSSSSSTNEAPIGALQEGSNQLVPPPSGGTGNTTGITEATATLHGDVTPNGEDTQVYFQYGPSLDYGSKTPAVDAGSSKVGVSASADLTGLTSSTAYHYQEIIETPTHLLYGADETFTTQAAPGGTPVSTPQPKAIAASEPGAASSACR